MNADQALELLDADPRCELSEQMDAADVLGEVVTAAYAVIDPSAVSGTLVERMGALRRALDGES